ncbi:MAG: nicotinamide-nucleotide amidohydrolase family protein [Gammaproteobacteria bacterium]|nr:nicotinamide-nucleotide amidohydrolase family protein [Gammaproteobacteria bacterium]
MSVLQRIDRYSQDLGYSATQRGVLCCTAESCTGGMIAAAITDTAGSSGWFDRGFVTYTNLAKVQMLGVTQTTLSKYGAVSEPVVREMALGALRNSEAGISVAVSGIAGPDGGSAQKPVGTVCFAWSARDTDDNYAVTQQFGGDRKHVRQLACEYALMGLLSLLDGNIDDFIRS